MNSNATRSSPAASRVSSASGGDTHDRRALRSASKNGNGAETPMAGAPAAAAAAASGSGSTVASAANSYAGGAAAAGGSGSSVATAVAPFAGAAVAAAALGAGGAAGGGIASVAGLGAPASADGGLAVVAAAAAAASVAGGGVGGIAAGGIVAGGGLDADGDSVMSSLDDDVSYAPSVDPLQLGNAFGRLVHHQGGSQSAVYEHIAHLTFLFKLRAQVAAILALTTYPEYWKMLLSVDMASLVTYFIDNRAYFVGLDARHGTDLWVGITSEHILTYYFFSSSNSKDVATYIDDRLNKTVLNSVKYRRHDQRADSRRKLGKMAAAIDALIIRCQNDRGAVQNIF